MTTQFGEHLPSTRGGGRTAMSAIPRGLLLDLGFASTPDFDCKLPAGKERMHHKSPDTKKHTFFAVKSNLICLLLSGCAQHLPKASEDEAFLLSWFKGSGEDGLHLAYSHDGLKWQAQKIWSCRIR